MSKAELLANKQYLFQSVNRDLYRKRMTELNSKERNEKRKKKVTFISESESVKMYDNDSTVNDDSNVQVLGTVQVQPVTSPINLSTVGVPNGYPIADFWERKVKIAEFEINPTTINECNQFIINPFQLWTSNPSVRAKLYNYARAKFDLKLNITLSGSRYLAGSFLISNQPFARYNNGAQKAEANFTGSFDIGTIRSNCYFSQSPETRVLLIGEEDNDLEMVLPFIGPAAMMNLFNTSSTPGPTEPFEQSVELSTLYFQTLTPLIDYSEQYGESVAMVVYASAHNINLQSLTATELIVNESEQIDLSEHPISGVADIVTKVSDTLSKVPIIGNMASKVSQVASRIGRFARIFGFSKPSLAFPEYRYLPKIFGQMTNVEGTDPSIKFTLFPNQEVALLSMTTENCKDEMSYAYMCNLETYFTSFPWANTDDPNLANLAIFPVTPMLFAGNSASDIQHTPMSFLGLTHNSWRGTVTFKFEVVAPVASRGQLAFWFEPNIIDIEALAALELDLNKNPIAIMNIEQTRTLTIKCGFNSNRPVNRTGIFIPSFPGYTDTSTIVNSNAYNPDFSGFLGVTPFTRLQPASTQPIWINVYVSSDDMHFYDISYNSPSLQYFFPAIAPFAPEAGVDTFVSETDTKEFQYDVKGKVIDLYGCVDSKDTINFVYGEEPLSIRSTLKRYSRFLQRTNLDFDNIKHFIYPSRTTNFTNFCNFQQPGTLSAVNGLPATIPTLFDAYRRCFLFMRGGFRWKLSANSGIVSVLTRSINNADLMCQYTIAGAGTDNAGASQIYNTNIGGVEYEIPYYSTNLVYPSNNIAIVTSGSMLTDLEAKAFSFEYVTSAADNLGSLWGAIADDFSFVRYSGAPSMNLTA